MPETLYAVATIPEVARRWRKNYKTVVRALDSLNEETRLIGRKAGSVWLIDVSSVVRRWGQPQN